MLPGESLKIPTLLTLVVVAVGTLVTCGLSLLYFRRVRVERPAIGTFNGRDFVILFGFIIGLPLLYLAVPLIVVLVLFGITFTAALVIGLRPVLGPSMSWLVVGLLIGLDVWTGRTLLGTIWGWQVFWVVNAVMVIGAAVSVSNLYAQGGMKLKHMVVFTLILAVYDVVFSLIWPVTNFLSQRIIGYPLNPSVGFRWGIFNSTIGIGDLLVYSLFVILSFKAYGPRAARVAMSAVVVFGMIVPPLTPIAFRFLIDARTDILIPAQTVFGPAAFLIYLWFTHRYGRERTMKEYFAAIGVPATGSAPNTEPAADHSQPIPEPPARLEVQPAPMPVDPAKSAIPDVRAKQESGR